MCGSWIFSTVVILGSHCDFTGLAAARIDVLAFNWQMIPALAIDSVCCSWKKELKNWPASECLSIQQTLCNSLIISKHLKTSSSKEQPIHEHHYTLTITSWRTALVLSFILSNSSMQQIPLSLSTRAPLLIRNSLWKNFRNHEIGIVSVVHQYTLENTQAHCRFASSSKPVFYVCIRFM